MFARTRLLAVLTVGSATALFRRKGGSLGEVPDPDLAPADGDAAPGAVLLDEAPLPPPPDAPPPPDSASAAASPDLDAVAPAPPDHAPLTPLDAPQVATRAAVEPAPHPVRPHEMWHPGVVPGPDDEFGTETDGPAVVDERSVEETARTVPIDPITEPLIAVPPPRISGLFEEAPSPFAADAPDLHESPSPTPASVPFEEAVPFVPPASTLGGEGLIAGPVARRDPADKLDKPTLRPRIGEARVERGGVPKPLTSQPLIEVTEQPSAPLAPLTAAAPAAEVIAPIAEPVVVPTPVSPAIPERRVADVPVPVERRAPAVIVGGIRVATRPAPTAPPLPTHDEVVDVLTLPLAGGSLRVSRDAGAAAEAEGSALRVPLSAGWCWAALREGSAEEILVDLPIGRLGVTAGTTALMSVDADGTVFIVVSDGEAVLDQSGGEMRLRSGALVLSTPGGDIQADVATAAEIAADPLVRLNLHLDATGS